MRKVGRILFLMILFLVSSCGDKDEKELKQAGNAAVKYYEYLIAGQYDRYVDGIRSCDSVPEAYRNRMKVLVKQFVAREKAKNGGLKSVALGREELCLGGMSANVFLNVTFGNGMTEEVVLPLVKVGKIWRMQ